MHRPCSVRLDRLSHPLARNRLGRCRHFYHRAEHFELGPRRGLEWNTRQMESTFPDELYFDETPEQPMLITWYFVLGHR